MKINIKEYDELKQITEGQAKEVAIKEGKIKEYFKYYIIDTEPYYGACFLVYLDGKQIYIDEQLQYPSDKNIFMEMYQNASRQLFTPEELESGLTSYNDYKLKSDYLINKYILKFEHISIYHINAQNEEEKKILNNYHFSVVGFCCFKNAEDLEEFEKLYFNLEEKYRNFKQDINNFEQAIRYEFLNHETFISGDIEDAIESAGYNPEKLSKEQSTCCRRVYREYVRKYC